MTAAAKAGARILAVERRQSLGGVANCPESIPIPLGLHARADHVVIQNIVGTRNHFNDGTQADSLLPGCVVNRDAFDRALVAADGHASSVARLLGLPALKKMYTRRYRVALHEPQDTVDVWTSPRIPAATAGWFLPGGTPSSAPAWRSGRA